MTLGRQPLLRYPQRHYQPLRPPVMPLRAGESSRDSLSNQSRTESHCRWRAGNGRPAAFPPDDFQMPIRDPPIDLDRAPILGERTVLQGIRSELVEDECNAVGRVLPEWDRRAGDCKSSGLFRQRLVRFENDPQQAFHVRNLGDPNMISEVAADQAMSRSKGAYAARQGR